MISRQRASFGRFSGGGGAGTTASRRRTRAWISGSSMVARQGGRLGRRVRLRRGDALGAALFVSFCLGFGRDGGGVGARARGWRVGRRERRVFLGRGRETTTRSCDRAIEEVAAPCWRSRLCVRVRLSSRAGGPKEGKAPLLERCSFLLAPQRERPLVFSPIKTTRIGGTGTELTCGGRRARRARAGASSGGAGRVGVVVSNGVPLLHAVRV
jgi:hypothetical protein